MNPRRTRIAIALLGTLVLALTFVSTSNAQTAEGARVDKVGWWSRSSSTISTPAAPVTTPPTPGIPEEDIAVGSTVAETSAIAGIGISPTELPPGGQVDTFVLRIAEDPDAGANQGTDADTVQITACPITEFWVGGSNSDYETRPIVDCELAQVAGTRGDGAVWTFDLTPIGDAWIEDTIEPNGVMLVPGPDSTTPFQAVFDPATISVIFAASGGTEPADPFGGGGFSSPTTRSTFSGGGSTVTSPPATTPRPTTPVPQTAAPTATVNDTPPETAPPSTTPTEVAAPAAPTESQAGNLIGNQPPVVFLGFLLFALLFLSMSYWFGPAGEPEVHIRQRGVSRALALRASESQETP